MTAFGPVAATPVAALPGAFAPGVILFPLPAAPITAGASYSGIRGIGYGGTGPYTYALATGTLPSGLSVNASTGYVEGITNSLGTTSGLSISATDSLSVVGTSPTFSLFSQPAGITRRSMQPQRMRTFWWNPTLTVGRQGQPPGLKRAQRRVKKTIAYNAFNGLKAFKVNSYTVVSAPIDQLILQKFNSYVLTSPPVDSVILLKFNSYAILEITPPAAAKPYHRIRRWRAPKRWKWHRPRVHYAPPANNRRPVLYTVT